MNEASHYVPYYSRLFKNLGVDVSSIKSIGDLPSLPILNKKLIRNNFYNLQSIKYLNLRVPWFTGGSTGEPLRFFHDKLGLLYKNANTARFFGWAGYFKSKRIAYLHGLPTDFGSKGFSIETSKLRKSSTLHFSLFGADKKTVQEYIHAIKRFNPDGLRGNASFLCRFASEFYPNLTPSFIISGSEILLPHERRIIEEKFGCSVWDIYGSREFSLIASECSEHSGYHIAAENLVVEIVDNNGQPVPPGAVGRILITDLTNYSFPFIRYEIGDLGALSADFCSCGRGLPLIKKIDGRTGDKLLTNNGQFISAYGWGLLFKEFDIKQFQIVQKNSAALKILIDPGNRFNKSDSLLILKKLRIIFPGLQIELEYGNTFHSAQSGKKKIIVSDLC